MHVSELIRDVATQVGFLSRDDKEELDWTLAKYHMMRGEDWVQMYPTAIYRVALGLAWEEWLGRHDTSLAFHGIGELEREGIIGTPDGLDMDYDGLLVHEIKLTWKSSRSDRETPQERFSKEWMWQAQGKSYCYLADAQLGCVRVIFHVFWVNGNYKGSGPEYRKYMLQFEPQEILTTWRQLALVAGRKRKGELYL